MSDDLMKFLREKDTSEEDQIPHSGRCLDEANVFKEKRDDLK